MFRTFQMQRGSVAGNSGGFDTLARAGSIAVWIIRAGIWTWVTTRVYRVTRWRKWKLAVVVAAGLALNVGVEFGLSQLGDWSAPAFGSWIFRLCYERWGALHRRRQEG